MQMQINRILFFAECNLGRKIQLGRLNEVHCIEANKIVFSYNKSKVFWFHDSLHIKGAAFWMNLSFFVNYEL